MRYMKNEERRNTRQPSVEAKPAKSPFYDPRVSENAKKKSKELVRAIIDTPAETTIRRAKAREEMFELETSRLRAQLK